MTNPNDILIVCDGQNNTDSECLMNHLCQIHENWNLINPQKLKMSEWKEVAAQFGDKGYCKQFTPMMYEF
jgi:hypothetical protein